LDDRKRQIQKKKNKKKPKKDNKKTKKAKARTKTDRANHYCSAHYDSAMLAKSQVESCLGLCN
jgi:hypothetical protein